MQRFEQSKIVQMILRMLDTILNPFLVIFESYYVDSIVLCFSNNLKCSKLKPDAPEFVPEGSKGKATDPLSKTGSKELETKVSSREIAKAQKLKEKEERKAASLAKKAGKKAAKLVERPEGISLTL